jgi:hypothetical protein
LRNQKPLEATLQELSLFANAFINDNFDSRPARRAQLQDARLGWRPRIRPMILAGGLTPGERQASDSFGAPVKACAFPPARSSFAPGAVFTD